MMYKDREKQKEANRAAAKRQRDKRKGMTGMTGMTAENVIPRVIPKVKVQHINPMMVGYEPEPR